MVYYKDHMGVTRKMNWFEYYFGHCFQTGWREMWNNFKMWRDLISGNYENYNLLPVMMTLMKSVITGSGHLSTWMKLIPKDFLNIFNN
jgi:hypothetical protein